jgi:N-acetylglucosaminyldiphosphoundecaprenol N-acetyl-beta-D-mannosaminyltransferase
VEQAKLCAPTPAYDARPRADVLGVKVDAVDMAGATAAIERAVRHRSRGYVCVTGMHGIMEAQKDARLRDVLNDSVLNVPDGMPTVWVGRLQGHRTIRRVFGPDLMLEFCELSARRGYTHFLYGGNEGVAQELAESLTRRFPGLRVVGTYTPPFRPLTPGEMDDLQRQVAALRPDVFWVGLSTPKQERFMTDMAGSLDVGVSIGVGAAFDYHTGRIADAPSWMKQNGLQWLHRLWQEPRRLWKRYVFNIPPFVFLLMLQLLGIRDSAEPRSGRARWYGRGDAREPSSHTKERGI